MRLLNFVLLFIIAAGSSTSLAQSNERYQKSSFLVTGGKYAGKKIDILSVSYRSNPCVSYVESFMGRKVIYNKFRGAPDLQCPDQCYLVSSKKYGLSISPDSSSHNLAACKAAVEDEPNSTYNCTFPDGSKQKLFIVLSAKGPAEVVPVKTLEPAHSINAFERYFMLSNIAENLGGTCDG